MQVTGMHSINFKIIKWALLTFRIIYILDKYDSGIQDHQVPSIPDLKTHDSGDVRIWNLEMSHAMVVISTLR